MTQFLPEFLVDLLYQDFPAMVSTKKLKSVDFYRKIPRDLTEASISGGSLSIIAALAIVLLVGMELNHYFTTSTTTSVVVDNSSDHEFLRMDFNISFPSLSCEFASVDVSDVLGTDRINVTKNVRKYSIDSRLQTTGSEFHSGSLSHSIKHDEDGMETIPDGAIPLNRHDYDQALHLFPLLVVNFYAPWCFWSNKLRPSWELAAKIMRERYDPQKDGRILLAKVDCTDEEDLCRRNHIQGYPSIRIFRRGNDASEGPEHESYYGDRDTDSLLKAMENLVEPIPAEPHEAGKDNHAHTHGEATKRPAPSSGGCRVEGFVRVKKVPGNLVISARSLSHSFDASQMNMSHVISHIYFGKKITPWQQSDMERLLPFLGRNHDRLQGRSYMSSPSDSTANVTIEHYLQVVKTQVVTRYYVLEEYEYTAHSSLIHSRYLPVAKFHFDPSPMQVLITEDEKSFSHFITNICAIIGGVFTVAGILDSVLHNSMSLMKKMELGKNF